MPGVECRGIWSFKQTWELGATINRQQLIRDFIILIIYVIAMPEGEMVPATEKVTSTPPPPITPMPMVDVNALATVISDKFLKWQENEHQKELKLVEFELHDRRHLTYVILGIIIVVFIGSYLLTSNKTIGEITFSFLLGTIVGSLFSTLSKLFPPVD